jgi:AcrR family transcriptional regulator
VSRPRTYHSPARAEAARRTRRRVVAAARELFEARGYAGTTIDAVAERAGVSRRTVSLSVGSKAALLKTAWDWAVVGDDEPVAMLDRPAIVAMQQVTDPEVLVRHWVGMTLEVGARVAALAGVLARAADVDAQAAELQERIDVERRTGAAAFLRHLEAVGGLRAGLPVEHAVDMCWILMNPLLQHRLRVERGWTPDALEDWLQRLVSASLLADDCTASP